jgi:hypothetical protein
MDKEYLEYIQTDSNIINILDYSESTEEDIRFAVAKNKYCPTDILEILSEDESDNVIKAVLGNSNITKEILLNVISNKKTSSFILKEIFKIFDYSVLNSLIYQIVEHENCNEELLEFIFNFNAAVIKSILNHKNCTIGLIEKISKDKRVFVGESI